MLHLTLNYKRMKRFLSWAFVVLSLCAGFASCSDDEDEVIPELIVNTPNLSIAGAGGAFEVPILTSGLALDETVEINTDVDWVTNLAATGESFSFTVGKAPLDVESRTATFTLSLSQHPAIKATCTLTQGKNYENFYIQMDELDGTCAIYTVVPASSQSENKYISYCFSSDELAQYSTATEVKNAIWAKQTALSNEFMEKYNKYVNSTLSYRARKGKESSRELVRDLEPGKEYTIVAFGYKGVEYRTAEDMEVLTDLVKYTFVAPEEVPEVTPTTLDMKVNVRGALYDIDITSSRSDVYIYPICYKKSSFDKYYPDDNSFILATMYYYYSGASHDQILRYMYKDSYQTTGCTIRNNQQGTAGAVAYDSHLNRLCTPVYNTFTVGEPQPSDNVLTISIPELKARTIKVQVKGSNSDPFYIAMIGKSYHDALLETVDTEEEKDSLMAAYILENGYQEQYEGNTAYSLWPTTDYVVLAVGVAGYSSDVTATTKVYKLDVTTPEAVIGTATCDFDIVKCFNSLEFAEAFDWHGWEDYRTIAFTCTQSDDAEEIIFKTENLNSFKERESAYEKLGMSDRFLDWQYMLLETSFYTVDKLGVYLSKEGEDIMIFAAAKDKDGNFGPLAHFSMECDKMPISPISEISVFNPENGADTKSIQLPQIINKANMQQPEAQPMTKPTQDPSCIRIE